MSQYDEAKCLQMSQSISAIYDNFAASPAEACSATSLALRVLLENSMDDKIMRGYLVSNIMKHLTMDKKQNIIVPAVVTHGN